MEVAHVLTADKKHGSDSMKRRSLVIVMSILVSLDARTAARAATQADEDTDVRVGVSTNTRTPGTLVSFLVPAAVHTAARAATQADEDTDVRMLDAKVVEVN